VVYADAGGTIGWQLVGLAPRRRKGHGLIPLPGWDPGAGWEAEGIAFEDMPHLSNPETGFVATANTQPKVETGTPYLGGDWIDGYRLEAITRALAGRSDWDVERTLALQVDPRTVAWEEIRPALQNVPAAGLDAALALDLLRGWDGRVTVDSVAATIYELFLSEMVGRVARARAPQSAEAALGAPLSPLTHLNCFCFRRTSYLAGLLSRRPEGWLARPWSEEIADALTAVVRQLRRQHGGDPQRWAWGRVRVLVMHHPLGGRSRLLGRIFNLGPVPCGGDTDTIPQATVKPLSPLAPVDNLASLRAVIDVGAWGNSRFVLPGGQSGNPLSPHYGDLFPLWRRGEGVPIAWTEEEVRQATLHTLELTPEAG
jgi:penicillin amidase